MREKTKFDKFGKIRVFDFWICGTLFWGHSICLNCRQNSGFSNFHKIYLILTYIWIVRSIICSPMLSYIWIIRSIFAPSLCFKRGSCALVWADQGMRRSSLKPLALLSSRTAVLRIRWNEHYINFRKVRKTNKQV